MVKLWSFCHFDQVPSNTGDKNSIDCITNTNNTPHTQTPIFPRLKNTKHTETFIFASLNCQSLKNKTLRIMDYLKETKINVAFLQETWMRKADKSIYAKIKEYGFGVYDYTRETREGGGVAIVHEQRLDIRKMSMKPDTKFNTFEHICCTMILNKTIFKLINIYRPPYSINNKFTIREFFNEFIEFLSIIVDFKGTLLILGDLNINLLDKTSPYTSEFLAILNSYDLKQLVESSTHTKGGLLDVIILEEKFQNPGMEVETCKDFMTDHYLNKISINISNTITKPKIIQKEIRTTKNYNVEQLVRDVELSNLCKPEFFTKLSPFECTELYNKTMSNLYDHHCPIVVRRYRQDKIRPPWYNSELQKMKQNKRRMERKFKKIPIEANKIKLKESRNQYNDALKRFRSSYYKSKIQNCEKEPKILFNILGKLCGTTKERTLPKFDSEKVVAEQFSEFYIEKILKIRKDIEENKTNSTIWTDKPEEACRIHMTNFVELKPEELNLILNSMKKKTSKLDPVPTTFVKNVFPQLLPFFLYLINSSIRTSSFPENLKHARVTPVIKDPKLNSDDLTSYRLISNLPFLSKILEKTLHIQLDNYIEQQDLHAKFQSAYRKNNSCETAIIRVMDDIQQDLFYKNYVALLLLDASSAFDTVDHSILWYKLEHEFHIGGSALSMIKSYLKNRSFSVAVNNTISKPKELQNGVPQGSILGPLTYILYTKELELIAKKYNMNINTYADDIQLYISFSFNDINKTNQNVTECLLCIKEWMDSKYLKLNTKKTQLKIFNPYHNNIPFQINYLGEIIDPIDEINILGIRFTNNLDLTAFILKKVWACNLQLRNLNHIRDSLPFKTRLTLITSTII